MTHPNSEVNVSRRKEFLVGVRSGIPFAAGGFAFGIVFGTVAQDANLSMAETVAMSALINGGTAQMIAVGMIIAKAPIVFIVAVCAIVNLRHVFYSAALSEYVRPLGRGWRLVLGFLLIDQVFALAAKRYGRASNAVDMRHWYVFGAGLIMYVAWLISTAAGWYAGSALQALRGTGVDAVLSALDFVIYAIFIGLVMSTFGSRRAVAAGISGGVLALALHFLPFQIGLFFSILLVVVGMALWERKSRLDAERPSFQ